MLNNEILVKNIVKTENLFFRDKIKAIEKQIDLKNVGNDIILNFKNIKTINRAVANQIEDLEKNLNKKKIKIKIVNANKDIKKLIEIVKKPNKKKKINRYEVVNFVNI